MIVHVDCDVEDTEAEFSQGKSKTKRKPNKSEESNKNKESKELEGQSEDIKGNQRKIKGNRKTNKGIQHKIKEQQRKSKEIKGHQLNQAPQGPKAAPGQRAATREGQTNLKGAQLSAKTNPTPAAEEEQEEEQSVLSAPTAEEARLTHPR